MAGSAQRTTARKASGEYPCPACQKPMRCPSCDGASGGRKGGKANVPKGFALNREALKRAMLAATARARARQLARERLEKAQ